jgi:hypothetical protein
MSLQAQFQPEQEDALAIWGTRAAALATLPGLLNEHPATFQVNVCDEFLDIACRQPVRGRVNRSRLRVTCLHDDEMAVVFYRSGLAPHGTGFGYGGLAVRGPRLREQQVAVWLQFLAAGFAEDEAPRGLQTVFQYPVPDVREP